MCPSCGVQTAVPHRATFVEVLKSGCEVSANLASPGVVPSGFSGESGTPDGFSYF